MKIDDIDNAFDHFREIDILNCSKEGSIVFNATKAKYEAEVDVVEKTIINKIRERLGAAANASEMFRVFKKFSSLLKRPQVKSAIIEYQKTMVKSFKDDLNELREKMGSGYTESGSNLIAEFYDIPDLTGSSIWNQEINRKLKSNIENIKSVMGDEWFKTKDGRKISEYDEFFTKKFKEGTEKINAFKDTQNTERIEHNTLFVV